MGWKVFCGYTRNSGAPMKLIKIEIPGVYLVNLNLHKDDRGYFARTYCENEFKAANIQTGFVQCNISFNKKRGTLRGMHYQDHPHWEAKLIRCTHGKIFDVIIDLRKDSSTYGQSFSVELSSENKKGIYIPKGIAHGFQTLEDDTEVFYQMSEFYYPDLGKGIRWNDPIFKIRWPLPGPILSERDQLYEDFKL
jgi:dTDP-4-dehydrorhamnose 3,5-epimerase